MGSIPIGRANDFNTLTDPPNPYSLNIRYRAAFGARRPVLLCCADRRVRALRRLVVRGCDNASAIKMANMVVASCP
jgi:hypothetical protein